MDQGWLRPDSETDKLYMSMGGGDIIEVGHPTPRDGQLDPRYVLHIFTNYQGMSCEGACAHAHVRCAVARVRVRARAKRLLKHVCNVRACRHF